MDSDEEQSGAASAPLLEQHANEPTPAAQLTAAAVVVSNLSKLATEDAIRDYFGFCGDITEIIIDRDSATAIVSFAQAGAAQTATLLSNGILVDTAIVVMNASGQSHGGLVEASDKIAERHTTSEPSKLAHLLAQTFFAIKAFDDDHLISVKTKDKIESLDPERGMRDKVKGGIIDIKTTVTTEATALAEKYQIKPKVVEPVQAKAQELGQKALEVEGIAKAWAIASATATLVKNKVVELGDETKELIQQRQALTDYTPDTLPTDATASAMSPGGHADGSIPTPLLAKSTHTDVVTTTTADTTTGTSTVNSGAKGQRTRGQSLILKEKGRLPSATFRCFCQRPRWVSSPALGLDLVVKI